METGKDPAGHRRRNCINRGDVRANRPGRFPAEFFDTTHARRGARITHTRAHAHTGEAAGGACPSPFCF